MSARPPDPFMPRQPAVHPGVQPAAQPGVQSAAHPGAPPQHPAAHQPRSPQERYAAAQAAEQASRQAATNPAATPLTVTEKPAAKSREGFWKPVSTAGLVAFIMGTAWLALLIKTDKDGFIQVIDSFNLVVHEFGHPLFANFGEEPGWWGGTIAQLVFPLIFVGIFVFQRHALSALFCMVWFFENTFNVARYVADARAEELPLVSPGGSDGNVGHDWNHILGTLGQLENDLQIASTLRTIGWIGIAACIVTAIVLWSRQAGTGEDAV